MSGPDEPDLTRGVQNPRVVDLVEWDAEAGQVVLVISEDRPWGSDPNQLVQLEDKVNSYLGYALDGHLATDYPDYEGKPVRLQIDCAAEPGPGEIGFMNALRNYCSGEELDFRIRVVSSA